MCQIFWHLGTGQRAVPLEPALLHPLFFLIFSLSAQGVHHFAPISRNLGSGPTKLTLVFFWRLNKNSLYVLDDRSKYPPRHLLLIRPALFHCLVEIFQQENCVCLLFLMTCFVIMCQIFWHMGTGQRAVPLEPALLQPFFFLIFSLSAQRVRHFAPISSNLGSWPTKLTLVIFWGLNKNSLYVLDDRSKYPPRHLLLIRPALFHCLVGFFQQENCVCLLFLMTCFVIMCQIFWHMGTGQRAVSLEPALWHPLFFWSSV